MLHSEETSVEFDSARHVIKVMIWTPKGSENKGLIGLEVDCEEDIEKFELKSRLEKNNWLIGTKGVADSKWLSCSAWQSVFLDLKQSWFRTLQSPRMTISAEGYSEITESILAETESKKCLYKF